MPHLGRGSMEARDEDGLWNKADLNSKLIKKLSSKLTKIDR
jgi:hypothetical protein